MNLLSYPRFSLGAENGKRNELCVCSSYACVHIVTPPRSRPEPYYMYVRRERERRTRLFCKIHWKKVLKDRDQPFETQIPLLPPYPFPPLFPSVISGLLRGQKWVTSMLTVPPEVRSLAGQIPLVGTLVGRLV